MKHSALALAVMAALSLNQSAHAQSNVQVVRGDVQVGRGGNPLGQPRRWGMRS